MGSDFYMEHNRKYGSEGVDGAVLKGRAERAEADVVRLRKENKRLRETLRQVAAKAQSRKHAEQSIMLFDLLTQIEALAKEVE